MTSRDSLKSMVKMMEYVNNTKDGLTKEDFTFIFGDEGYKKFKDYCIGGEVQGRIPLYAEGPESPTPSNKIKLSTGGMRHLYEIRRILAEERRNKLTGVLTFVL